MYEGRCLLISDFTIGGLAQYLQLSSPEPRLTCVTGPFDQVSRTLLDDTLPCWTPTPDVALVWTRPEAASPAFGRLCLGQAVDGASIVAEVDALAQQLLAASQRVGTLLVPSWTRPPLDRGLGALQLNEQIGPGYHLLRMNARLVEATSGSRNVFVLDASRWVALAGLRASSPKLWYMGKIAYGPEVFRHAALDIKAAARAVAGRNRKLVVLDLDDTLWGGIVGDSGWEQLILGGHDPVGEAYRGFQSALKSLTERGIVLGIVSKNTETVALEALDRHPEMVLRRDDFAGWRINWEDKAANIVALTTELNLGLDAVVFIDDNPAERERVRGALPEVLTPEWPRDPMLFEQSLKELDCFDTAVVSDEDRERSTMYARERARQEASARVVDMAGYLRELQMRVAVQPLGSENLARACQLLNKTNQMNLRTRRMTQDVYLAWASAPAHRAFTFQVADRFGNYGLTALASFSAADERATIEDFVVSCRVLGRGVEETILHLLVQYARSAGCALLEATLLPTARNQPCRQFFDEHSRFRRSEDRYTWDTLEGYLLPGHVTVLLPDSAPVSAS